MTMTALPGICFVVKNLSNSQAMTKPSCCQLRGRRYVPGSASRVHFSKRLRLTKACSRKDAELAVMTGKLDPLALFV